MKIEPIIQTELNIFQVDLSNRVITFESTQNTSHW